MYLVLTLYTYNPPPSLRNITDNNIPCDVMLYEAFISSLPAGDIDPQSALHNPQSEVTQRAVGGRRGGEGRYIDNRKT